MGIQSLTSNYVGHYAEYVSDADFNDDIGEIDNRVATVQCVDNLIAPFGCYTICTIWLLHDLHHLVLCQWHWSASQTGEDNEVEYDDEDQCHWQYSSSSRGFRESFLEMSISISTFTVILAATEVNHL